MVTFHKNNNDDTNNQTENYPIFSKFKYVKEYSDIFVKIPSELNIKHLIRLGIKSPCINILKKGGENFKSKKKCPYLCKYISDTLD